MTITLSQELEELIVEEVAVGKFESPEAVLVACLHVLKSQRELRAAIQAGIDDIENGRHSEFDPEATLARVRAKRKAEGRSS